MRKLTNYSLYPFPYIYLCLLLATLVYRIYLALPSNHNQTSKHLLLLNPLTVPHQERANMSLSAWQGKGPQQTHIGALPSW